METIGSQTIWGLFDDSSDPKVVSNTVVRRSVGHRVKSYVELVEKIAALQFMNREHVLLFRGQTIDYQSSSGLTTLKPTIFRPRRAGQLPTTQTLATRFATLRNAESKLLSLYTEQALVGADRLARHRLLRWAILQHYDVCATPLLDVSQSLRVAASFGSLENPQDGFLYVLAVPNLSGAVTASSEASMQIVRLLSACPPSAMRPHFQEGYLLGEYPEIDFSPVAQVEHNEMDFGRRLIAKFRFDPKTFWRNVSFPRLTRQALFSTGNRDFLQQEMLYLKEDVKRPI